MDTVIDTEDLVKEFGDLFAVDGLTFDVGKGTVASLLGPNGAGKTTTVEILEGLLLGSVIKDPESSASVANAIGFPMMFLSGTFWPIDAMPGYIQTLAQVLPLTYLNEGLRQAMVYGNMDIAAIDLAVLAVAGVVVFVLAARFMSWKER